MTSCPEARRIWKKKTVSWDSSLEEGSRFLVSPRRDQLGSTKYTACLLKKLRLSHLMSKKLKFKKVIKRFSTWTNFVFFGFLYVYEHYEHSMNICTFHGNVSETKSDQSAGHINPLHYIWLSRMYSDYSCGKRVPTQFYLKGARYRWLRVNSADTI